MGVDKTVRYIGNTFSPAMLKAGEGCVAVVEEIDITAIPRAILAECKSVVSHEVTAKILSAITGTEVSFNRVNIALTRGDVMYCIVPNFRANEAREFTEDEVRSSGFRAFLLL
ncbi:MAG: hypothetical protein UZ22_OP11002000238 [Microgenomates bacterium OLB23]|nr:MAG: hypothetical protein UZ22_OP11002000238 [Microgenomates bacterium OLB23]